MFNIKPKSEQVQEQNGEYQSNMKTLWIYTSLFCLFALVLILLSSLIQTKIDKRAEYYQDQYENAQTTAKSTIKNIKDENNALKADIELYKQKASESETALKNEQQSLAFANEIIKNAQYVIDAQTKVFYHKNKEAKKILEQVDEQYLTEEMLKTYESLAKRVGL